MMAHAKVLLVEGEEDKRVIPQLVEANGIKWGEKEKEWIVEIQALGSVEKLLDKEEDATKNFKNSWHHPRCG